MRASAAVRAAMRGNDPTGEQFLALGHPPVPLAIIAGAGSGKTAIMAARMVWMVERGLVRPGQILGLTFTNKAATELEERIESAFDQLTPHPGEIPMVLTYNSFADRIVRQEGVRVGIDPESSLLSQAQTWQVLAEALGLVEPFEAIDSRSIASITKGALSLADQCANNYVSPEEVIAEDRLIGRRGSVYEQEVLLNSRKRIELCKLVRAYQDLKRQRRCMDFGDQVTKAVEILESWPEVAGELRSRFPAILLDEYQDTNVAQRKMMQTLAPAGSNVTAVGDARQNIFQWRGSTIFNLIDFPNRHFLRAGGQPHQYLSLSDNFRSGSRVVEVANSVISEVPARRRPGMPLNSVRANQEGFVGTKLLGDQREEAAFIAGEILRFHDRPVAEGREPTCWKDFAVLVRRKSHMSLIYQALHDQQIPVEVAGLGGLLQLPEVMDTICWLRLVFDPGPGSNRWLARIAMGPRYRVHYRDLAVLARWAAARTRELRDAKAAGSGQDEAIVTDETAFEPDEVAFSLVEALDQLEQIDGLDPPVVERLTRLRGELGELRAWSGDPLLDLVHRVVTSTGIEDALLASGRRDASASLGNLRQFVNMVANFAPVSGQPSLTEFLSYLDAAGDAEDSLELEVTPAEDSVKLTTVHGAKGLEFEVVFVPVVAASENAKGEKTYSIFPDERASNPMVSFSQLPYGVREDKEHLPNPFKVDSEGRRMLKSRAEFAKELKARAIEDERRLFYVALTRAKQRLYVTASWWYERQNRHHGSSIFFEEVAAHPLVEDLGRDDCPANSPLMAELEARAVWPPHHDPVDRPSRAFPVGPVAALEDLIAGRAVPEDLLERLDPKERAPAERMIAEYRAAAAFLTAVPRATATAPHPRSLTASQAVALASGRLSVRQLARPLPQAPTSAARIGSEIHRWIEERTLNLTGLADEESLDSPGPGVDPQGLSQLKASFERMGYGGRTVALLPGGEPMAELRFALKVGDGLIRGRMDAVYRIPGGGLEIVDFKTGAQLDIPEIDQLAVYAVALHKMQVVAAPLTLTYCYLAAGQTRSCSMSLEEIEQASELLRSRLGAIT
ncbi:MAG: UvrD-helicase domain-containing protein [Actinomycetota bacterium]